MGRPRNRPTEFPTDWHWEQHHDDLDRALAGAHGRLAEAEQLPKGAPYREQRIADAKAEIEGTHAQLEHYGWGQKLASKRPAGEQKKTRSK